MVTRARFKTDANGQSDRIVRIGPLFTQDHFKTGPEWIQKWTCCFAGPVLVIRTRAVPNTSNEVPGVYMEPFGIGPDRFQTVPCKQNGRSGPTVTEILH